MTDWILYHNSHDRGFPEQPKGRFRIEWFKNVSLPKGTRVWMVASRRAKPQYQYFLVWQFIADRVGDGEASGSIGTHYGDSVRIDTEPWFKQFRDYMGQFGRGLSPLPPEWVRRLERAVGGPAGAISKPNAAPARPVVPIPDSSALEALAALEAERITLVRREQQAVRRLLLAGKASGACSLCGAILPSELLIAAHIKPRAMCTDTEKRDVANNTALMCTLGCDALFERGYVSVVAGKIVPGPTPASLPSVRGAVSRLLHRECTAYSTRNAKYFRYRQDHAGA